MKVLLDEAVPRRLAAEFPVSFGTQTVQQMGWGSRLWNCLNPLPNPDCPQASESVQFGRLLRLIDAERMDEVALACGVARRAVGVVG